MVGGSEVGDGAKGGAEPSGTGFLVLVGAEPVETGQSCVVKEEGGGGWVWGGGGGRRDGVGGIGEGLENFVEGSGGDGALRKEEWERARSDEIGFGKEE